MKTNDTHSTFTRRSALGLILAGLALPTTRALAGKEQFTRIKPHISFSPIKMTACSGETLTARFDSDLTVGASGSVRGYVRFDFGAGSRADFMAEVGGLDFDEAGQVIAARILLVRHRSAGRLAQDYALVSVAPVPGEDCLIYTTIGTQVGFEQRRFEVPGAWTVRR